MTRRLAHDAAAFDDLADIWSYSRSRWGKQQADRYPRWIEATIRALLEYPQSGRERSALRPGYWSKTSGRHILFYTFDESELRIRRVLHASMDVDP